VTGGAEHGAAVAVPGADDVRVEVDDRALGIRAIEVDVGEAHPAVPDADDLVADAALELEPLVHGGLDDPLESGVEAGAIAAAGQHPDAHLLHGHNLT
jgi:hypothetical protein